MYSVSDLNKLVLDKEIKKPLALVTATTDLLMLVMVSDSHSHSVYQVSISNNGAFLQGTLSSVIKLPETANPVMEATCMFLTPATMVESQNSIWQCQKAQL